MVTSPSSKRGYTTCVLAKMARLQGAPGIDVGTMGHGNIINTAGGGSYGHIDGQAVGTKSLKQA